DTIVVFSSCDYAANIEASVRKSKGVQTTTPEELKRVHTPNITSIEDVSNFLEVTSERTLKAVVKRAIYTDGEEIVIFFLRGSDELQEVKAANSVDATELTDVSEEELKEAGIIAGFISPIEQSVKCIFDNEIKDERSLVCGANEIDYHYKGFDVSTIENAQFADLISVSHGNACSKCGAELRLVKGIEVGHIFQLGSTYSAPLGANFLDENGKSMPMQMGTYGIGISRLVAAVIEQHHDDKGCIWTTATTPYSVNILISNIKNDEQREFGMSLYEDLKNAGIETIIDDRSERFGFKIKDAELLGFRYTVIVGKGLKDNKIEILKRDGLIKMQLDTKNALEEILEIIS
ncbi:MAG: proline--tRNA ligase, partial [Gimesia sp.]